MRKDLQVLAAIAFLGGLGGCGANPEGEYDTTAEDTAASADDSANDETEWCDLTGQDEAVGECERLQRQYSQLEAGRDAFKPDQTMVAGKATVVSYAIKRLPKAVQGDNGEIATPAEEVPSPPPPPPDDPSPTDIDDVTDDAAASADSASEEPAGTSQEPTQAEIDQAIEDTDESVSEAVVPDAEVGSVVTGQIKIARFMYACLEGDPIFKIEPEECQSLDTLQKPQPVFRWRVTPSEPAEDRKLQLTAGIEVRTRDGSPRRIGQAVREAEIDVTVTRLGQWKIWMSELEEWLRSPLGVIAALTALVGAIGLLIGAVRRARKGEGPPPADPKG
jgi:hypothetical protein